MSNAEMLCIRGKLLPMFRISSLFQLNNSVEDPTEALVVIVEDEGKKVGFMVDSLVGHQQIVIKSLGESMGQFFNHDLISFKPPRTGFCLIVCKNVLLHLKPEDQVKVIQMFHDSLEQDGYFVTEQTQKMPDELSSKFERVVSNAQLFKKYDYAEHDGISP